MRKFITFFLSALLTFVAIGLVGCGSSAQTVSKDSGSNSFMQQSENAPAITLSFGKTVLKSFSTHEGAVFVSKTVTAEITPNTVGDKYVTWSLAWANDAPLKNTDISDYLEITEESQGELTATVNCYQPFRGSKAILTCTTRQGNKTATCEVIYNGEPSSMSMNSVQTMTQYNLGNMNVDMMYIGTNYSYGIALDNIFHDTGTNYNDYTVDISGVGTVTCGEYRITQRGSGWNSHNAVINFASIASNFIHTSVSGNTLTIMPTSAVQNYYESYENSYSEQIGEISSYHNKFYSFNTDNDGNLPYFIVTVSHRTLNISAQIKFFVGYSVNNVQMSATTITF